MSARCDFIIVTSCKGGVGKSTCAANIALSLARIGKKTLVCDCSFGMRCLDLLLGVQDEIVYDLGDVIAHRVEPTRALIRDTRSQSLYFLAAPFDDQPIDSSELKSALVSLAEEGEFDAVLLDTPAGAVHPALIDTRLVTAAVVVASHQPTSIRAADATGEQLTDAGIDLQRLVINSFDFDTAIDGTRPGINEIIDRCRIRLGGIVPYDRALMLASDDGKLAAEEKACKNSLAAFDNIAKRLTGRYVPLFEGFSGFAVKRKITRLLG